MCVLAWEVCFFLSLTFSLNARLLCVLATSNKSAKLIQMHTTLLCCLLSLRANTQTCTHFALKYTLLTFCKIFFSLTCAHTHNKHTRSLQLTVFSFLILVKVRETKQKNVTLFAHHQQTEKLLPSKSKHKQWAANSYITNSTTAATTSNLACFLCQSDRKRKRKKTFKN